MINFENISVPIKGVIALIIYSLSDFNQFTAYVFMFYINYSISTGTFNLIRATTPSKSYLEKHYSLILLFDLYMLIEVCRMFNISNLWAFIIGASITPIVYGYVKMKSNIITYVGLFYLFIASIELMMIYGIMVYLLSTIVFIGIGFCLFEFSYDVGYKKTNRTGYTGNHHIKF